MSSALSRIDPGLLSRSGPLKPTASAACADAQEAPVLHLSSLVRTGPACRATSARVRVVSLSGSAACADAGVVARTQS
jgi:hypothetical protein